METKKQLQINPFVLMFFVIIVVSVLTFIVPAGNYERIEEDGKTYVNPDSFTYIDSQPVGLLQVFKSFHLGMEEGASIILFVILFGGALGIMKITGTIDALIKVLARNFKDHVLFLIPILTLVFALMGSLIGSAEDTLVYIAIIVPLMIALKLDTITGFAIVMLGTMGTGFVAGITNPFNVAIAQNIAELPPYSGIGFRVVVFVAFYLLTVSYIFIHVKKIRKDPSLKIMGSFDDNSNLASELSSYRLSKVHLFSIIIFLISFIILVVGVIKFNWFISEIAGLFLFVAILMALFSKISPNQVADGFIEGSKEMVSGALIIGVAQTILIVIREGAIIDTFLHSSINILNQFPASFNAVGMFFIQLVLNFFVPSGSGQAALTMPIMTPLSDLLDITRQTAVLAFQFGDGISNLIIPTSGVLLAGLAIAGIPFTKWVKWIFPYFVIQTVLAMIFLIIAYQINLGPF